MALDPITVFYNRMGRYPANNKQWWIARAEIDDPDNGINAGDFQPDVLDKLWYGNMLAPRGHFVLDAFNKDRSFVSGIEDLPVETTAQRPSTVAFFAGRVWYGVNSTVYFSQMLTSKKRAGLCYQEADPTSEAISDLISTDGGEVPIPEAHKIIRLLPHQGGVMVFAQNGVWFVSGSDDGFAASDISVNKVSPIGCQSPMSIVETDQGVFWWSNSGILAVSQASGMFGPIAGKFEKQNITEATIQSFYNDIPDDVRSEVKGVYDYKSNRIVWLYRDEDVSATQYNRALNLDGATGAFYPWKFSSLTSGTIPYIKGLFISDRINSVELDTDTDPSQIEYTVLAGSDFRIAQVKSGEFVDWYTVNSVGVVYDSYVETGFEIMDDAMRKKAITYLFAYLRRTETEFADEELDDPSSCFLRIKFDWSTGTHSNKWTTPVQVYRHTRFSFDPDTGFAMVVTKNKVRGNGKSIQFRFGTDESGRNFDLQGWSIALTGNTQP